MSKLQFIALFLLCTFLGLFNFNQYSLVGDEFITVNISTGFGHTPNTAWNAMPILPDSKYFTQNDFWNKFTFDNVLKYTADDNGNMISYNLFLYYYFKLIGYSDYAGRFISFLSYFFSALLLFKLCKLTIKDNSVAFLATILFLVNPLVMNYGRMIRSYEFTTFLCLLSTYIIFKFKDFERNGKKAIIGYGLLYGMVAATTFLAHYFALYVIAAHFVYTVVSRQYKTMLVVVLGGLIVLGFFILWYFNGGGVGMQNMASLDNYILLNTSQQTLTSFRSITEGIICFLNSVSGYYFQYYGYRNSEFFALVFIILFILISQFVYLFFRHKSNKKFNPLILFCWITFVCCLGLLTVASIKSGHTTSFHSRYGIFLTPFLSILLASGIIAIYRFKSTYFKYFALGVLLIHISLNIVNYKIVIYGYYFSYTDVGGEVEKARNQIPPKNKYCNMATQILTDYKATDTLIFSNSLTAQYCNLYFQKANFAIIQTVDNKIQSNYLIK